MFRKLLRLLEFAYVLASITPLYANLIPEALRSTTVKSEGVNKLKLDYKRVTLPKGTDALLFTAKVRYDDVVKGKKNWNDARIMVDFTNLSGKKIASGPAIGGWKGSSKGEWKEVTKAFYVPKDAGCVALMPAQFNTASGILEVKDMSLTLLDPIEVEFVGFERSKPLPIPPNCKSQALDVKGNRIVTEKDSKEVWLQGVNIVSLEWCAAGEHLMESVEIATTNWNANVIRLCLHSKFWFGRGPWQKDGGKRYRALVDKIITYMQSHGKYVLVDLHEFRAPEWKHAAFWLDVSTRYRNHPGVLFGLFNEPHNISWEVWRNGGWVTDKKKKGDISENNEVIRKGYSIGMQKLIDVIRQNGAKNLITAGGLDWSYDLSGVWNGYALNDTRLIYETHIYPWKRGWEKHILPAAEKHPILIGEVGAQPKPMPFENAKQFLKPEEWVPNMLGLIQAKRLNWTAWCLHPRASPCLIEDWSFKPTPYWGIPAREALHGKPFPYTKNW